MAARRACSVAAQSLHHTKARDTKEVVQRYRGDFVTVEAHLAGACEVMAFSGAVCCAGASNGGLLVPGACASVCFCFVRACILLSDAKHVFAVQGSFPPAWRHIRRGNGVKVVCRGAATLGGAGCAHVSAHWGI